MAEVRSDPWGDKFHFDGTYLYLRVVAVCTSSGYKIWDPRTQDEGFNKRGGCPDTNALFAHDGLAIPARSKAGYRLKIEASCTPLLASDGSLSEFCAAGAASGPPSLSTGVVPTGRSVPAGCPASPGLSSLYLYSSGDSTAQEGCDEQPATSPAPSPTSTPPPPPTSSPLPPPPDAGNSWDCKLDEECSSCSEDASWEDALEVCGGVECAGC